MTGQVVPTRLRCRLRHLFAERRADGKRREIRTLPEGRRHSEPEARIAFDRKNFAGALVDSHVDMGDAVIVERLEYRLAQLSDTRLVTEQADIEIAVLHDVIGQDPAIQLDRGVVDIDTGNVLLQQQRQVAIGTWRRQIALERREVVEGHYPVASLAFQRLDQQWKPNLLDEVRRELIPRRETYRARGGKSGIPQGFVEGPLVMDAVHRFHFGRRENRRGKSAGIVMEECHRDLVVRYEHVDRAGLDVGV